MFPLRGLRSCALAAIAVVSLPGADLRMQASTTWAENIARSSHPADQRTAVRYEGLAAASLFRQWTDGLITVGEIGAGFEAVPRYNRTDATLFGFDGRARQKFGWGAFAPVLAFEAGLQHRAARLDDNDGWTSRAGLSLGKRLTPAWRLTAVGDWEQHDARNQVFDTRHRRLFGVVTWDLSRRLQLSHGIGRLWGDFTANASSGVWSRALSGGLGPKVAATYNVIPWRTTDAYGPGWVTYRVTGRVNFWWLELSPALGRDTSLPLRCEVRESLNQAGIRYRQEFWSVQWLHRF
jgi:hypothetical protein